MLNGGAIFAGEKGRIEIVRYDFRTDPPLLIEDLPPRAEVDKWRDDVAKWQAKYHMQERLERMRSRKTPSADAEIGHRSVTVCHLANITRQLNRKLKRDPEAERFAGDAEANALLRRPRRKGYASRPGGHRASRHVPDRSVLKPGAFRNSYRIVQILL